MSFRSKSSLLTKVRKPSSSALLQSEKRRSTSNLVEQPDLKIDNILLAYKDAHKEVLDIRIINQSDPFSDCEPRHKDEVDENTDATYVAEDFNIPTVLCYGRNDIEGPIRLLFKNRVYEHIIPILILVTPYFKNLLILQLAYCGLKDLHLSVLKNILDENLNIKFLSLEGNPLLLQAYNDILKTQLTHLSLRSCQITLNGIKSIAEQLQQCDLISLNLSSNYLDDDCLLRLSDPLKLNRKLISIHLADNWFTDIGLINFINIFKKFQLTHSEVVLRRRANLKYLREQQVMVNDLIISGFQLRQSIASVKSVRPSSKRNSSKASSVTSQSFITASPQARALKRAKENISKNMKKDANPLIIECFPENNSIYCRGNFVVSTIDLSCNNITPHSLKELVKVLKYQNEYSNDNKCLQKLLFDDRLNRKYPLEVIEIFELLKANHKSNKYKTTDKIRTSSSSSTLHLNLRSKIFD